MRQAKIEGTELAYDVSGSGEPVLLIGTGPIRNSFSPLVADGTLADRWQLVGYHQRRMAAGADGAVPVSFARHAADAAALLGHLGIRRAHVAGHSTGACIALQLAADHPALVHSLVLLEPPLLGAPGAAAFFGAAAPALDAYGAGDRELAMARFLGVATSLEWERCRALLERCVPGGAAQVVSDADDFFGSYLPALEAWRFGAAKAAALPQPVLSVVGAETERFFADGHDLLHGWFPRLEACVIPGVAHLLHVQRAEPVARGIAGFLARHPIASPGRGVAEPGVANAPSLTGRRSRTIVE